MAGINKVENQFIVEQELKKAGLPRLAIAALLGRIEAESGFDPSAANAKDPNGGSFGIFQVNGSRRRDLERFAAKKGSDPTDIRTQAQALVAEIKGELGTEGNNGKRLLDAKSPEDAAEAVMGLARPAGFTRNNPRGGLGFKKTLDGTKEYIQATNQLEGTETSPFSDGFNLSNLSTRGNDETTPAAPQDTGPLATLDRLLLGVTGALAGAGKAIAGTEIGNDTVAPARIDTSLINRQAPSISNFLRTLPGVGLQQINRK